MRFVGICAFPLCTSCAALAVLLFNHLLNLLFRQRLFPLSAL
jgi:hypothetical protein